MPRALGGRTARAVALLATVLVCVGCRGWVGDDTRSSGESDDRAASMQRTVEPAALEGFWVGTHFAAEPPETMALELRALRREAGGWRFFYRINTGKRREEGRGFASLSGTPPVFRLCLNERACADLVGEPPAGLRLVSRRRDRADEPLWELTKR